MLQDLIPKKQVARVLELLMRSKKVAIVCHMTPDGDALGSSLCLWHLLRAVGKTATVVTPDCAPSNLMFLPGADSVVAASCHQERARHLFNGADLIFCLDFNDLKRIDRAAALVGGSNAPIVVIDHHLNPSIDAEVLISHPEKSSTSALVYHLICQLGLEEYVTRESAECCCMGMMTDTGNFSYNSNDPDLYVILSRIVAKGVDKDALYAKLFNTNSLSRLRIMGYSQYAKMEVMPDHHCAVITLSREELDMFGYRKGDTESLVNVPLSIPGVVYSIYLREDAADYVKVSMRSKGDFSVKSLCETYFGGGGHLNAAGGEFAGSLSDALDTVLRIIPQCDGLVAQASDK